MNSAFRKLPVITLSLFVLAVAQTAPADMYTQTLDFGTEANPLSAPFTDSLTFKTFDTHHGTLTGLSIALSVNGTVTSVVTSTSTQSQTYTNASTTGAVSITGPDSTTVSAGLFTTAVSGTIDANSSMTVGTDSGTVGSTTSLGMSHFSPYETVGTGSYVIDALGTVTDSGTTSSSLTTIGGSANLYGSVTITYTYTPAVPEPMSLVMVAVGLGGLYAVRRVRRKLT